MVSLFIRRFKNNLSFSVIMFPLNALKKFFIGKRVSESALIYLDRILENELINIIKECKDYLEYSNRKVINEEIVKQVLWW